MGRDEVATLRTLTEYRVIIDRLIASHRGRIFNTAGDSLVADFASAVDAVQCAVAVQDAIAKENADTSMVFCLRNRHRGRRRVTCSYPVRPRRHDDPSCSPLSAVNLFANHCETADLLVRDPTG